MSKHKLVITHNYGFFSCCTIRLRKIIEFYNEHKTSPIVDSSAQWGKYKDKDGDVTHCFFKTTGIHNHHKSKPLSIVSCETEEQFSDYNLINYEDVAFFIQKYFTLSDDVIKFKQQFLRKYNINVKNTLAVIYRGNDKCIETQIPSHQEVIDKLTMMRKRHPKHKIIVQSDESELNDKILSKWPDIIMFNEIKTLSHNDHMSVPDVVKQGEKTTQAQQFLAVLSIISECDKIILNSGNVALWVCLYRGHTKGVLQYLQPIPVIWGVPNQHYQKFENPWIDNDR
jgi:hypothetical protein